MLWWKMESWPTKMWGIGEKRLRTPGIEARKFSQHRVRYAEIRDSINVTYIGV